MRLTEHLADPWALAVAAAAGLVAYAVAVPVPYAVGAAVAVVLVRLVAGILLPVPLRADATPSAVVEGAPPAGHDPRFGEHLTAKELEIAALVYEGLRDKEIAGRLGVEVSTVHKHMEHIRDKLGVTTRTEVAKWWAEQRIRNPHT